MHEALSRQLLDWLAEAPRSYRDTMEAWRTSCPRLSIWEDALADGLVEVVRSGGSSTVRVTDKGRAFLGVELG